MGLALRVFFTLYFFAASVVVAEEDQRDDDQPSTSQVKRKRLSQDLSLLPQGCSK